MKYSFRHFRSSGVTEDAMTELKNLLTSVANLEDAKPDKQVKAFFSKKDRAEAEAIRANALREVDDSDSSCDEEDNIWFKNLDYKKPSSSHEKSSSDYRRSNPKKDLVTYLEKKNEVSNFHKRLIINLYIIFDY